jgi:hypothetical protein
MKKGIMLFLVLFGLLANSAMSAEPIQLKLPWVTLQLPFQNVSGEYLYDIKFQKNLLGLATPIILGNDGKNRLTVGGAVEEGKDGLTTYLGFDTEVSEKYWTQRANVGVWIGADFDVPGDLEDKVRGGIKGSLKFW